MRDYVGIMLTLDTTNEEIVSFIRVMHKHRQEGTPNITLTIHGFDDDPRELYEVVEVRALCRRLVDHGFISGLDIATTITPNDATKGTLGAMEVWLLSENRMARNVTLMREDLDEFRAALDVSNKAADKALE